MFDANKGKIILISHRLKLPDGLSRLPNETIRQQIFNIHFDKRDITTSKIDVEALANACEGFSGSEIEQAIVSAMYANHSSKTEIDTQTLLDEIKQTRPLSIVMAEQINQLRHWASQRTVSVD